MTRCFNWPIVSLEDRVQPITFCSWVLYNMKKSQPSPHIQGTTPLPGNTVDSALSPGCVHAALFTGTPPHITASSRQVGRIKGIVRDAARVWWEATTLKQHFTSTHYILHNSEDLVNIMRAARSSALGAIFMGTSEKPACNTAIIIDSKKAVLYWPNGKSQCNVTLALDLIKKSCWKHCHVPITSRPAGQLTVIEGNFPACGENQEVKTTIGPL